MRDNRVRGFMIAVAWDVMLGSLGFGLSELMGGSSDAAASWVQATAVGGAMFTVASMMHEGLRTGGSDRAPFVAVLLERFVQGVVVTCPAALGWVAGRTDWGHEWQLLQRGWAYALPALIITLIVLFAPGISVKKHEETTARLSEQAGAAVRRHN